VTCKPGNNPGIVKTHGIENHYAAGLLRLFIQIDAPIPVIHGQYHRTGVISAGWAHFYGSARRLKLHNRWDDFARDAAGEQFREKSHAVHCPSTRSLSTAALLCARCLIHHLRPVHQRDAGNAVNVTVMSLVAQHY
jgi:hypothetical protein